MGMDIGIYMQRKTNTGWKNIGLYNPRKELAGIWRRGYEIADYIKDGFHLTINDTDIEELKTMAFEAGWRNEEDEEDENGLPLFYVGTYTKVKYLARKEQYNQYDSFEEAQDQRVFWNELDQEIANYLEFADYGWMDPDNIRVIAFESF